MENLEDFVFPAIRTRIHFGAGMVRNLPEVLRNAGSEKVLVVTDPGIEKAGILGKVMDILKDAALSVSVYSDIPQDSSTLHIGKASEYLKSRGITSVVGLGGGSSMDAAKAVAVAATNTGSIARYAGLDRVVNDPLPIVAVPTTSGTGSEVSYWSVMTDDSTGTKIAVGGEKVFPTSAVCDPELTIGMPPSITASTGLDALTHAIESYVNKAFQPVSSALAYRAIELAGRHLTTAVNRGEDLESRYGMMLSSTLAGLAMNPTRLGLVHALAMPLGSWNIHIPHGVANAILLAPSIAFNHKAAPNKYAEVALALGANPAGRSRKDLASESVEIVARMVQDCGVHSGLSEVGLSEEDISRVCTEAMKSGNIPVNPRPVSQGDLENICREAL